jgi:hypothetical protein
MMDHEDIDLDAVTTISLYYHRSVQIVEILNKAFHGIGRLTRQFVQSRSSKVFTSRSRSLLSFSREDL